MEVTNPCCYILFSVIANSFYIGYTRQKMDERLNQHNTAFFGVSHFTAKVSDWQVYLQIECESVEQAVKVEAHIKRMKSRKYLFDLKAYPTLVEKLKSRYSV
jgi:putative endonuclease